MTPLLEMRGVSKRFARRSQVLRRTVGWVNAVDGVDLTVGAGETVGLVGESGSGKSTIGRLALGLLQPTAGTIVVDGVDLASLSGDQRSELRRSLSFVFQDPYSSLDPLTPVGESVVEPLRTHGIGDRASRRGRVAEMLELVGLGADAAARYPRQFSGGQLQRVAIARALVLEPKLIVLDEPVSSLDVSTQGEIINLLDDLQARTGVAFLFISHDLTVVEHVSDRIAVAYLGRIVEQGTARAVTRRPRHPYTLALLSAVPGQDRGPEGAGDRIVLRGDLPSPSKRIEGCRFHTRCPFVMDVCRVSAPEPYTAGDGTLVECHLHTEGPRLGGESVVQLPLPGRVGASS